MRKLFFLSIILTLSLVGFSQSYLGWITSKVNFREVPNTNAAIIGSLNLGAQIFIVSLETENDFYNIIDIKTNTEGYASKKYVKIGKQLRENEEGIFTPNGQSSTCNPELEIYNNTKLNLTLKLNSEMYLFKP